MWQDLVISWRSGRHKKFQFHCLYLSKTPSPDSTPRAVLPKNGGDRTAEKGLEHVDCQSGVRRDTHERPCPVEDDKVGLEEWMAAVPAAADEVSAAVWMNDVVSYLCTNQRRSQHGNRGGEDDSLPEKSTGPPKMTDPGTVAVLFVWLETLPKLKPRSGIAAVHGTVQAEASPALETSLDPGMAA